MSNHKLRDELLELEPYPEDLKEVVREVAQLRERPLKAWERPSLAVFCVLCPMVLIGGPICLITYCPDFIHKVPVHILAAFPFLFLLLCWLLVVTLLSLKRGTRRCRDDQIAVYAGAAFVLYVFVAGMLIDSKHIDTSGLAVSILAVIGVIWVRIEEAETRLREHALRNELAVAKLAELIAARNAVAPKIEPTP